MNINNGPYLGYYARTAFIPAIEFYIRVALDKIFPALSDEEISREADQVEQEAFARLGQAVAPEDYDPSNFTDKAFEESCYFYQLMKDTRQGLINLLTAGLFHLFEQQLCQFYLLLERDNRRDSDIHQTWKSLEEEDKERAENKKIVKNSKVFQLL